MYQYAALKSQNLSKVQLLVSRCYVSPSSPVIVSPTIELPTWTPTLALSSSTLIPSATSVTSTPPPPPPPPTPLPSATHTPIPTLAVNAARTYVENMLATNGNCELPCWWGIVPGQSKWIDVTNQFTEIGFHRDILSSDEDEWNGDDEIEDEEDWDEDDFDDEEDELKPLNSYLH